MDFLKRKTIISYMLHQNAGSALFQMWGSEAWAAQKLPVLKVSEVGEAYSIETEKIWGESKLHRIQPVLSEAGPDWDLLEEDLDLVQPASYLQGYPPSLLQRISFYWEYTEFNY